MILSQLLTNPFGALVFLASIVMAVTVHEFCHAKVADLLGDPTPGALGRVTLNPLAHLDLFGSLMFLIVGFGWGKPVPFDPYNLKHPRRDAALIAFAGPVSNAVMALLVSLLIRIFPSSGFADLGTIFVWINISLGIFNLIPIAPLDGFKVVGGLLSQDQAESWYSLERYGMIFLLLCILPFAGGRSMLEIFVSPIINFIVGVLLG